MRTITAEQAIAEAFVQEMRRDARVIAFGEGVATLRPELVAEFGAERVRNTPLAEAIIAGTAAGAAATGLRPIADLLYAPFMTYAMDALVNSAGKLRFLSGGQFSFPLVALARTGSAYGVGAQHNHNLEAWFAHAPGLKVVMPSTPADFKGLLAASIRDDNPVVFFADMGLLGKEGEVPEGEHVVPLGRAAIVRAGSDVTLVSYAKSVHACLEAAEALHAKGIAVEVVDLRTIKPLDEATVLASVRKTGRAVIVHEAGGMCGVGAEVAARISEHAFEALKAPVLRLTGPDAPAAASYPLEQAFAPQAARIEDAVVQLCRKELPRRRAAAA